MGWTLDQACCSKMVKTIWPTLSFYPQVAPCDPTAKRYERVSSCSLGVLVLNQPTEKASTKRFIPLLLMCTRAFTPSLPLCPFSGIHLGVSASHGVHQGLISEGERMNSSALSCTSNVATRGHASTFKPSLEASSVTAGNCHPRVGHAAEQEHPD